MSFITCGVWLVLGTLLLKVCIHETKQLIDVAGIQSGLGFLCYILSSKIQWLDSLHHPWLG